MVTVDLHSDLVSNAVTYFDALFVLSIEIASPYNLSVHFHYDRAVFPFSTNKQIPFNA